MPPPDLAPKHADLQLDEQGSPEELIARCDELAAQDKEAEGRAKLYKKIFWAGVVSAVIWTIALTFFAPFVLGIGSFGGSTGLTVALVVVLVMVLLLVGSFVAIILASKRSKAQASRDLEDRKVALPRCLLEVLKPEIDEGRPGRLWVDFRAHDKVEGCGRVLSNRDLSLQDPWLRGSIAREAFRHPWLWLSLRLSDGTGLALQAVTTAKRKTTDRYNAGTKKQKRKLKVKEKVREQLWVQLSSPKGGAFSPAIHQGLSQIGAPPGMRLRRCKVSGKQVTFVYEGGTASREFEKAGYWGGLGLGSGRWQGQGAELLLNETNVLQAVILSYKALALVTQPYQGPA